MNKIITRYHVTCLPFQPILYPLKWIPLRLRKYNDEETYEEASLIDGHGRDLSSSWDFNIHLTHWT